MSLYDRIRDPDPYVRLYALIEVAMVRERAALADALALHLHVLVNALEAQPASAVSTELGDTITKSRALLSKFIQLNQKEI